MQAGLTNANAEPLRRDIEVGMSAILLLTQLFSLLLVFLWRHLAAFRRSRGLAGASHGGDPAVALGASGRCCAANTAAMQTA